MGIGPRQVELMPMPPRGVLAPRQGCIADVDSDLLSVEDIQTLSIAGTEALDNGVIRGGLLSRLGVTIQAWAAAAGQPGDGAVMDSRRDSAGRPSLGAALRLAERCVALAYRTRGLPPDKEGTANDLSRRPS
jgi:hypothetical protein